MAALKREKEETVESARSKQGEKWNFFHFDYNWKYERSFIGIDDGKKEKRTREKLKISRSKEK